MKQTDNRPITPKLLLSTRKINVFLRYECGQTVREIAKKEHVTAQSIRKWIKEVRESDAIEGFTEDGLKQNLRILARREGFLALKKLILDGNSSVVTALFKGLGYFTEKVEQASDVRKLTQEELELKIKEYVKTHPEMLKDLASS